MWKNYIKIAWRNLVRHKAFSIINIAGLAIGMAACLLILQHVIFELSYDKMHSKADRIYRVRQDRYNEGELSTQWAGGAYAVGNSFKDAFDEIETYVKLVKRHEMIVEGPGNEQVKIKRVFYATQDFFKVFSFTLTKGNPGTVLEEPNKAVITQEMAFKLFGSADPIGKTIQVNREQVLQVSGVVKDFPENSHLHADMLVSYSTFVKAVAPNNNPETAWQWDGCLTYLLLRPNTDPKALEAKFPPLVEKFAGEDFKRYHASATYLLQPLRSIHLYSHYMEEAEPNGDGNAVYESEGTQYRVIGVDYDYVKTFGMQLIAGRDFSKEFGSDNQGVIFNKMGIRQLGFDQPEQAIGKKIEFWGETMTVVGVVENFHQQSLREAYEPLILQLIPDVRGPIAVKLSSAELSSTLGALQDNWSRFFPANPFEYFFLDDHFNEQYQADQRFGQVFGFFTILAMLVACLGLFGLASFMTVQRTKEIGVRKVLGASVGQILQLLYREFAILVLIAFLVATPLAWFAAHQWLQTYAFRTELSWMLFVPPFLLVLMIALLTVSFQSIKAALANPMKSLRSE